MASKVVGLILVHAGTLLLLCAQAKTCGGNCLSAFIKDREEKLLFCIVNLNNIFKKLYHCGKVSKVVLPLRMTLLVTLVCLRLYIYSTCVLILLLAQPCGCFCLHGSTTVIKSYRDRLQVFLFAGCEG